MGVGDLLYLSVILDIAIRDYTVRESLFYPLYLYIYIRAAWKYG